MIINQFYAKENIRYKFPINFIGPIIAILLLKPKSEFNDFEVFSFIATFLFAFLLLSIFFLRALFKDFQVFVMFMINKPLIEVPL